MAAAADAIFDIVRGVSTVSAPRSPDRLRECQGARGALGAASDPTAVAREPRQRVGTEEPLRRWRAP